MNFQGVFFDILYLCLRILIQTILTTNLKYKHFNPPYYQSSNFSKILTQPKSTKYEIEKIDIEKITINDSNELQKISRKYRNRLPKTKF
jgi:hypothetical protein